MQSNDLDFATIDVSSVFEKCNSVVVISPEIHFSDTVYWTFVVVSMEDVEDKSPEQGLH